MSKKTMTFTLTDDNGYHASGRIVAEGNGLCIYVGGYGNHSMSNGHGQILALDLWEGELSALLWPHFNEDVTSVSLEDAREPGNPALGGASAVMNEIEAWAKKHRLWHDCHFWDQYEWEAKRREGMCRGAEFVLTAEGALNHSLNGHHEDSQERYKEFNRISERFGYRVEQGYSWSWHFYRVTRQPQPAAVLAGGRGDRVVSYVQGGAGDQTTEKLLRRVTHLAYGLQDKRLRLIPEAFDCALANLISDSQLYADRVIVLRALRALLLRLRRDRADPERLGRTPGDEARKVGS